MIRILKKQDTIYRNYEEKTIDENGEVNWTIPEDIDLFKKLAVDTLNWEIAILVKEKAQNNILILNAVNSKAIAFLSMLIGKLIDATSIDLDDLTTTQSEIWDSLLKMGNSQYTDSELLKNTLINVEEYVKKGGDKINRILNATTIDDIIEILNESW